MSASSSLDTPLPDAGLAAVPGENDAPPPAAPDPAPDAVQTPRTLLKELEAQFPVFRDHLPLAIGINKALFQRLPDLNKKLLRIALSQHTHSTRYLRATTKAVHRFDLDGNPVEELAEEHRQHAVETLRERLKKQEENRRAHSKKPEKKTPKAPKAPPPPVQAEKLALLAEKFGRH